MWKKFFGKKKPKLSKEKVIYHLMQSDQKIFPILKPGDWEGISNGALYNVLVGSNEEPKVIIAYGFEIEDELICLTKNHIKKQEVDKVLGDARNNLEAFKTDFSFTKNGIKRILNSSGLDYSSERILSRMHMSRAHKMLETPELLVSIPSRKQMTVISKNESKDLINQFIAEHLENWQKAKSEERISDLLFVVKEAEIIATLQMKK